MNCRTCGKKLYNFARHSDKWKIGYCSNCQPKHIRELPTYLEVSNSYPKELKYSWRKGRYGMEIKILRLDRLEKIKKLHRLRKERSAKISP